jgi:predicted membrane channel-forming protein YqfA (hemolysin III family)
MANLKTNLIEFGVTFVFLIIFVALLAIAEDTAGQWSILVYLGALVAFSIALCALGYRLAPNMYDQYS